MMESLIVKTSSTEPVVFLNNEWDDCFVKDGWLVVKKGFRTVFAAPEDKVVFYRVVKE